MSPIFHPGRAAAGRGRRRGGDGGGWVGDRRLPGPKGEAGLLLNSLSQARASLWASILGLFLLLIYLPSKGLTKTYWYKTGCLGSYCIWLLYPERLTVNYCRSVVCYRGVDVYKSTADIGVQTQNLNDEKKKPLNTIRLLCCCYCQLVFTAFWSVWWKRRSSDWLLLA